MRLLTHNMLMCHKKGVQNGWPLKIEVEQVVNEESEFNKQFIINMLGKIDYEVFKEAAKTLEPDIILPAVLPTNFEDEAELKQIHHGLMEVSLKEGNLICPESGRKFPVKNGIPNMLLNEDEV